VKRLFFALPFIIFSAGGLVAQDCANALIEAEQLINSGKVEAVSEVLNNCLDKLSREDRVEAFKKLSIAYLLLDDPDAAERSFLALLNLDPEFRVSANDPIELHYLAQQYITTPIISLNVKAGGNISAISVIHSNSTNAEYNDTSYKPRGGYNFTGGVDLHFNKVISLFAELEASMWQYEKVSTIFRSEETSLSSRRINYQAGLPLGFRFTYPGEVSFPYIYGGYHLAFTYLSNVTDEIDPFSGSVPPESLTLTDQVNQFTQSLIFGLGYERRIGRQFGYKYLLVDLRFRLGLTNITNEKTQFDLSNEDNQVHITKFLQVDDDYRWNSIELTVGYVWPQYKPRKKNTVTLQSTLKKWFTRKDKNE
jgi:hypothetical protein